MKHLISSISTLLFIISLQGQASFFDISEQAGINHWYQNIQYMGGGAAWFDMNKDGYEDLWITGGNQFDKFYINNQDGTFRDASSEFDMENIIPKTSIGVITGDLNNDGHREVILITGKSQPNQLLLNQNGEHFINITEGSGLELDSVWTNSVSLADINLDGYLDIYFGNYMETPGFLYDGTGNTIGFDHSCYEDALYINNGDLTFTKAGSDIWSNQTGCVLASCFTDFDQDGDADLMVANDFGEWITPNKLFVNNYPENSFSEMSQNLGADPQVYGMGIAVGDIELDGDLDYYITNLGRNVLLEQSSEGFNDIATEAGVEDTQFQSLNTVGWGTVFEDINRDLYPDLFVSNGFIESLEFIATNPSNPNRLFLNNQDGTFTDISVASGFNNSGRARGLASADYDNDGDVDIMIINVNGLEVPGQEQKTALFQNNYQTAGNWISISLEGTVNNFDAYGSLVKCYLEDKMLIKELSTSATHASQNSSVLHFGLDQYQVIDSIVVSWPGGKSQIIKDIQVNQRMHIVEDESLYSSTYNTKDIHFSIYPNPVDDLLLIDTEYFLDYKLFDIQGNQILKGNHRQINVSMLNSGMYILEVNVEGKRLRRKVIKQ